ncbi:MAG: threonine synthase [Eubacteriales bacterium]|nr:threonine synthase [Eubacteriales bacterium]
MRFVSTRGGSPKVLAPEALLGGIAPDGGLYLPDSLPRVDWDTLPDAYLELAAALWAILLPGFTPKEIGAAAQAAYGGRFDSPQVAPVRPLGDAFVLELFHGPTAAFKDLALTALPQLMVLARGKIRPGHKIFILAATSGDTGSAAMAGFRDLPDTKAVVFYPQGGVSPVQEAQMRRMPGGNLEAFGIRGDFDMAQAGVKSAFARTAGAGLPEGLILSSANSINIGRLVPQVVYYFSAYKKLVQNGAVAPGDPLHVVVPSGNFGNILAALLAKRMGLPLGRLACASNQNRVLTDFLATGRYDKRRGLQLSLSPSMDILVSSNVERLLSLASGGDSELVAGLMNELQEQGHYQLSDDLLKGIQADFLAVSAAEEDTLAAIRQCWDNHRYVLDPHAAVAWHAYGQLRAQLAPGKTLVLATASPFKFPEAVLRALGEEAPEGLSAMRALSEKTGLPPPKSLSWLEGVPELRGKVIDPRDIPATAFQEAKAW